MVRAVIAQINCELKTSPKNVVEHMVTMGTELYC